MIRDDAVSVYPLIARSSDLIYVSRIFCGSYDVPMKTMLERSIPVQQAFIRLYHGETHHMQRAVVEKDAVILAYGDTGVEEQAIFRNWWHETPIICCFGAGEFALLGRKSYLRPLRRRCTNGKAPDC